MGTNYYIKNAGVCSECGGTGKIRQHIGKQSFGWPFLFNPKHPSFKDWVDVLQNNSESLVDEYGRDIGVSELITLIKSTKDKPGNWMPGEHPSEHEVRDEEGYRISKHEEFS